MMNPILLSRLAVAMLATTLASSHCEAAEPASTGVAAKVAFTQITSSDSGGFTGRGTGKALSIDGSGKFQAKRLRGPDIQGQLNEQQLAELSKDLAAVDWANVKKRYPTPGADMIQNDLVVIIDGKTHEVHAVEQAADLPPALKTLFNRIATLHKQFAVAEK